MPKDYSRIERIGELIRRELSVLIQREIKDPRLGIMTVTHVTVTNDLSHAKIYFTLVNEEADSIKNALEVLQHASGFLRFHLAKLIKIRSMPELHFMYDKSLAHGKKMTDLIDDALAQDKKLHDE